MSSISDRGEMGFGERNRKGSASRVGIGAIGRLTFRRESSWKGRRLGDWAYHQEANAAGRGVQPWGSRR